MAQQDDHDDSIRPPLQQVKESLAGLCASRQATWFVLRRPADLSSEDRQVLALVMQAHPQLDVACKLAQAFALMVREKKVSALEPWLQEASGSGIAELHTFATGIKRDQAAVQAALTYDWSQRAGRRAGSSSQVAQAPIVWAGWI